MIFLGLVLFHGEGIWKASGNCAKQGKEKHLGVKDTENKRTIFKSEDRDILFILVQRPYAESKEIVGGYINN